MQNVTTINSAKNQEEKWQEEGICCICGIRKFTRGGNNPDPVKMHGRCCNLCNDTKVIPARERQSCGEKIGFTWEELMEEAGVDTYEELFYPFEDNLSDPELWMIKAVQKRAEEIETYLNTFLDLRINSGRILSNITIKCCLNCEVSHDISKDEKHVISWYDYDFNISALVIEEPKELEDWMIPIPHTRCISECICSLTDSNEEILVQFARGMLYDLASSNQA